MELMELMELPHAHFYARALCNEYQLDTFFGWHKRDRGDCGLHWGRNAYGHSCWTIMWRTGRFFVWLEFNDSHATLSWDIYERRYEYGDPDVYPDRLIADMQAIKDNLLKSHSRIPDHPYRPKGR